ncbi:MAG: tetratricopeptide repeat protein [Deinococcota bacterium]
MFRSWKVTLSVLGLGLLGFGLLELGVININPVRQELNRDNTDYVQQLEHLNETISSFEARAATMPNSWFALELVAANYLARARLTGNYDDYAAAEQVLAQAFALSGEQGGANLSRAQLNYSLHRISDAQADLAQAADRLLLSSTEQAAITGYEGDVLFYQGDYAGALAAYEAALELAANSTNLFRLAHYYWRTGDTSQAEDFLTQAETASRGTDAQLSAFFHLHRGLIDLDLERYDDALTHYYAADRAFSGWWLVREHIAEIYVEQGKLAEARNIYEQVIAETGSPEFMDALAGLAELEGNTTEAESLRQQARAVYEQQLVRFPEASYGHALGHFLDLADDPDRTLELAQANYSLRPYGESALLLAQAHLLAGQPEQAQLLVDDVLASSWHSADVDAVLSQLEDIN